MMATSNPYYLTAVHKCLLDHQVKTMMQIKTNKCPIKTHFQEQANKMIRSNNKFKKF